MTFSLISIFFLAIPLVVAAQSVQTLGTDLIDFINSILFPLLLTIALVIFISQMVRYFIIDVDNYEYKERARNYTIYALIAFVLMVSVWGIVNLIVNGTGLGRETAVCPDTVPEGYCETEFSSSGSPGDSNNNFGGDSAGGNWGNLWEKFGEIGDKYFPGGSDASTDDDTDSSGNSTSGEADGSGSADAGGDAGTQDNTTDSADEESWNSNTEPDTTTAGEDSTTGSGVDVGSNESEDTTGGGNAANSDSDNNSTGQTTGTIGSDSQTQTESYICQYKQKSDGSYDRTSCLTGCQALDGTFIEQAADRALCTYTQG